MTKQYSIFTSIYSALDFYSDHHPERSAELIDFLSDANPHIWAGESSGDPAVYEDYLDFLSTVDYENLSVYEIAKLYFAQLDAYYAGTIKLVASFSEEEFNVLLAKSSQ